MPKKPPRPQRFRTFKVRLCESRVLTCYIDAISKAEAIRTSTHAWKLQELNPARDLPFEVSQAALKQPVTAHLLAPAKRKRASR